MSWHCFNFICFVKCMSTRWFGAGLVQLWLILTRDVHVCDGHVSLTASCMPQHIVGSTNDGRATSAQVTKIANREASPGTLHPCDLIHQYPSGYQMASGPFPGNW